MLQAKIARADIGVARIGVLPGKPAVSSATRNRMFAARFGPRHLRYAALVAAFTAMLRRMPSTAMVELRTKG